MSARATSFRRLPRRTRISSTTGLAPLVDVVLLLLIFLLVSARFDSSRVIEIELPRAPGPGAVVPSSGEQRVLTLRRDGSIAWNGTSVDHTQLQAILSAESPESRLLPIVIHGDTGATLGTGLGLVMFLRGLGYSECVFQFQEESLKPPGS